MDNEESDVFYMKMPRKILWSGKEDIEKQEQREKLWRHLDEIYQADSVVKYGHCFAGEIHAIRKELGLLD